MNRITELFDTTFPIIQAGMIWCSGWELASAVSNAGGLGLIGSGSMYPDILRLHIRKCKAATDKPFGVNIPLLYPNIKEHVQIILDENVPIVFSSAGNPKTYTSLLKESGIKVAHVVSNVKFALKSEDAGVDAIVAEGFEAGGHNGREETTTLCLVPQVVDSVKIPVIAAGGVGNGRAMAACFALGAEGVQVGSRFVATHESSAHNNFKMAVINAQEGETILTLKELTPVRLIKNKFFKEIESAYLQGASYDDLLNILGRGRAKRGMFEGDLEEGELEIGQVSSSLQSLISASDVVFNMMNEFKNTLTKLKKIHTSFDPPLL